MKIWVCQVFLNRKPFYQEWSRYCICMYFYSSFYHLRVNEEHRWIGYIMTRKGHKYNNQIGNGTYNFKVRRLGRPGRNPRPMKVVFESSVPCSRM